MCLPYACILLFLHTLTAHHHTLHSIILSPHHPSLPHSLTPSLSLFCMHPLRLTSCLYSTINLPHSHSFIPSPLTSIPHTHPLTLLLPHTLTPHPHHSPHSLTLTPSHPHHSSLPHTLTPSPLIPKPSTLSSPHHLTTHHSSLTPTQGLDNKLRKEVWRYLLNYFPFDMTDIERMEMRRRKEREYWTMKKQWQSFTEDQENRFTKWREAKQLISE